MTIDLIPTHASTFTIPDLVAAWPHSYKINPHHEAVYPGSNEWFDRYNIYQRGGPKREFFFRSNFNLMTSMCYPDADKEHLRNAMDFLNWLFSFDDSFDEELRGNADATKIASEIVVNVLQDPINYRTEYRLGQQLQDFWKRVARTATPQMQERFVDNVRIYLAAVHQQAVNFKSGRMPTVEEFIELRRDTSAAKPVLDFLEYTLNLDKLPNEFHEHPIIKRIKESGNDILAWTNDIHSYNIEQSRGDVDNLIIVAMHDRGYTLQQAIDFTGEMVMSRMQRFLEDRDQLPSFSPEIDEQAEIYMRGIELWVAGSISWNLTTERYFLKDHEEVRRTRVVRLMKPGAGLIVDGPGAAADVPSAKDGHVIKDGPSVSVGA